MTTSVGLLFPTLWPGAKGVHLSETLGVADLKPSPEMHSLHPPPCFFLRQLSGMHFVVLYLCDHKRL